MSIESVMPSSHLILCRPLLLLPSIFPNIRVFSNKSALHIRWPKYWNFSLSKEHPGLISFRMDSRTCKWVDSSIHVQYQCMLPICNRKKYDVPQHLGGTEPEGEAAQPQGWPHMLQRSAQWRGRKRKQSQSHTAPSSLTEEKGA